MLLPLTCSLCLLTIQDGLLCLLVLFLITHNLSNSVVCISYPLIFLLVDSIFLFWILKLGSFSSNVHTILFISQCLVGFSPMISSFSNLLIISSISVCPEDNKLYKYSGDIAKIILGISSNSN